MTRRLALAFSLALTVVVTAAFVAIGDRAGWFSATEGGASEVAVVGQADADDDDAIEVAAAATLEPPPTREPATPTSTPAPTVVTEYVYQDILVTPTRRAQPAPPVATPTIPRRTTFATITPVPR